MRIRLQDQPFELLAMLLERPAEVLTRDELRRRLWPDGTFVDFEHGLNAAVKRLRAALGDDAEHPRFVETLHRRGYRFIGAGRAARCRSRDTGISAKPGIGASGSTTAADASGASPCCRSPACRDDAGHEYFTEGLREEMITELGRLCAGRLGVIARTSSTLIQRTATRIRDIGQALRVDFVVEGNVRREGDRARITVQLIETRGETQLWADSYERHLSDYFQVQSEVATEIVHSLAVELLPASGDSPQMGTRHVDAHQAYLKGRYHWNKPGDEGARSRPSPSSSRRSRSTSSSPSPTPRWRARTSARSTMTSSSRARRSRTRAGPPSRALELDPTDSEAHLTLAEVERVLEWDWNGAEKAYRTALAFNPSNVAVHRLYGLYLAARGRTAEASAAADRAYDLDPLCLVVNTSAALVRFLARDFNPAIERCRDTLDMDDGFVPARRLLAAALLQAGRRDEATTELEMLARGHLDPVSLAWLAHGFATLGDRARAGGILEQLDGSRAGAVRVGVPSGAGRTWRSAIATGRCALLTQAFEQRDPSIINLGVEPRFEALGSDPRYKALVEQLALPD